MGGPGSEVEVDETFIGGKARNMHSEKNGKGVTGMAAASTRLPSWESLNVAEKCARGHSERER